MTATGSRGHVAAIAEVRTSIDAAVGIDDLAPASAARHPDPIMLARHRREIADGNHRTAVAETNAIERVHAICAIISYQPPKSSGVGIKRVQRRFTAVKLVQVGHQLLHSAM